MTKHEMTEEEMEEEKREIAVLAHLRGLKEFYGEDFHKIIIGGANVKELMRLLEDPVAFAKRSNCFRALQLYRIIDTIYEKRLMFPFPKIPRRTEKERILLNLLLRHGEGILGRDPYFDGGVRLHHVVAYLQRDKVIYSWERSATYSVMNTCERALNELLRPPARERPYHALQGM
jgi:hypothetical protein